MHLANNPLKSSPFGQPRFGGIFAMSQGATLSTPSLPTTAADPPSSSSQAGGPPDTEGAAPVLVAVVVAATIAAAIGLTYFCCGWRVRTAKTSTDVEANRHRCSRTCRRRACAMAHAWYQYEQDLYAAHLKSLERCVLERRTNARETFPRTYSEMGIRTPPDAAG